MAKSLQALWAERPLRGSMEGETFIVGSVHEIDERAHQIAQEQFLVERMHALYKAARRASLEPRMREVALWTMTYLAKAKERVHKQASQVQRVLDAKEKVFADWLL